jgi:hypothetical protein
MEAILKEKFWNYIIDNNPDLMFSLQENYAVVMYLNKKVKEVLPLMERLQSEGKYSWSVIIDKCMDELIQELNPSKFNYIRNILIKDFEQHLSLLTDAGVLTYEIINMIDACSEIFDRYGFSEVNMDNCMLMGEVKRMMDYYLSRLQLSA